MDPINKPRLNISIIKKTISSLFIKFYLIEAFTTIIGTKYPPVNAKRNKLIKQKMFELIIGLLGLGITYKNVVKINKNLFYLYFTLNI
jgi:hypothetical protein